MDFPQSCLLKDAEMYESEDSTMRKKTTNKCTKQTVISKNCDAEDINCINLSNVFDVGRLCVRLYYVYMSRRINEPTEEKLSNKVRGYISKAPIETPSKAPGETPNTTSSAGSKREVQQYTLPKHRILLS